MHGLLWRCGGSVFSTVVAGFATGMLESEWGRRELSQPTVHRPVSESPSATVTLARRIDKNLSQQLLLAIIAGGKQFMS